MRLFWVRHGEMSFPRGVTADVRSANRMAQQEIDEGLSRKGRAQAERAAEVLEAEGVEVLYSSPLRRARETAAATAARLGQAATIADDLREIRTGSLREDAAVSRLIDAVGALPLAAPNKRRALGVVMIPAYYLSWRRGRTVGGESYQQLRSRVGSLLRRLSESHGPDAKVALFAHGYLIYAIAHLMADNPRSPWSRPYVHNGSITELDWTEDRLVLRRFAAAEHLRR